MVPPEWLAFLPPTLLLALQGLAWSVRLAGSRRSVRGLENFLLACLMALGQVALMLLLLGLLGAARSETVILLSCLSTAVVSLSRGIEGMRRGIAVLRADLRKLAAGLARLPARSPLGSGLLVAVAGYGAWLTRISWRLPIHRWDDLAYHLPILGSLVATGRIPPLPASYEHVGTFLGTVHLIWAYFGLLCRDSQVLSLVNLLLLALFWLALQALLRETEAPVGSRLFLGTLAVFTPFLLQEAVTLYVDVAVAFLATSSLLFWLRWRRSGGRPRLLGAGIALGLLWGAKLISPWLVLQLVLASAWAARPPWRELRKPLTAMCLVLPVLLGSFWMVHKTVRFHNPVYPMRLRIGSVGVEGPMRPGTAMGPRTVPEPLRRVQGEGSVRIYLSQLAFTWLGLTESRDRGLHSFVGGFGPGMGAILLPAAVAGLWLGRRRLEVRLCGLALGITALPPLGNLARYVPYVPALAAVPAACWLAAPRWRRWILPLSGAAVHVCLHRWAPDWGSSLGCVLSREGLEAAREAAPVCFWSGIGAALVLGGMSLLRRRSDFPALLLLPSLPAAMLLAGLWPLALNPLHRAAARGPVRPDQAQRLRPVELGEPELLELTATAATASLPVDRTIYREAIPPPTVGLLWRRDLAGGVEYRPGRIEPRGGRVLLLRREEPSDMDGAGGWVLWRHRPGWALWLSRPGEGGGSAGIDS